MANATSRELYFKVSDVAFRLTPPIGGLSFLFADVIEDAFIVPVSVSYDKLVDGNFAKEQMVIGYCCVMYVGHLSSVWTKDQSIYI